MISSAGAILSGGRSLGRSSAFTPVMPISATSGFARHWHDIQPGITCFRSLDFPITLNGFNERSLFVTFAGRAIVGEEFRPVVRKVMRV